MDDSDVFSFVEKIDEHNSLASLLVEFEGHAATFGFDSLIITGLPIGRQEMEPMVLLNGWPKDWFERYSANHYADRDPVCLHAARARSTFDWSEVPKHLTERPGAKTVMNEATEFGLRSGLLVPCASRNHWMAAVALASGEKQLDLTARDRMKVAFMATAVAGVAERMHGFDEDFDFLTLREREVLTHAANGKTAKQLSEDLLVSHHTIVQHLDNIRRKFGVRTTIQATVKAIRLGLIQP